MIYKNFYNKYKMSEQNIQQNNKENKTEDIDNLKSKSIVLEEKEVVKEEPQDIEEIQEIVEDVQEQTKEEILLKLGDIILISDPTNISIQTKLN